MIRDSGLLFHKSKPLTGLLLNIIKTVNKTRVFKNQICA